MLLLGRSLTGFARCGAFLALFGPRCRTGKIGLDFSGIGARSLFPFRTCGTWKGRWFLLIGMCRQFAVYSAVVVRTARSMRFHHLFPTGPSPFDMHGIGNGIWGSCARFLSSIMERRTRIDSPDSGAPFAGRPRFRVTGFLVCDGP